MEAKPPPVLTAGFQMQIHPCCRRWARTTLRRGKERHFPTGCGLERVSRIYAYCNTVGTHEQSRDWADEQTEKELCNGSRWTGVRGGQSSGQKNQLPIRGTRERLKAKEAPNASSQLPCCAVRAGISFFMGQSTDAQRVICVKCRPNLYSRRPSPARNPLARRKRTRQIQLASRSVSCALEQ